MHSASVSKGTPSIRTDSENPKTNPKMPPTTSIIIACLIKINCIYEPRIVLSQIKEEFTCFLPQFFAALFEKSIQIIDDEKIHVFILKMDSLVMTTAAIIPLYNNVIMRF
jgi:hypothetical protein